MQIEQNQQQEQKQQQQEKAYEDLLVKNMEVLSVQNHIQGQFGVIGGSKVKDWSSPLTPPPPPPPPLPPKQDQPQPLLHKLKKQKQQHDHDQDYDSAIDIAKTDLTQEPKLPQFTTAGTRGRNRSRSTTPIPIGNGRFNADLVDGGGRGLSAMTTPKQIKFQLPVAVRPSSIPQQRPPQQREREPTEPPKRPQSAQPQPQAHYYYHNHQNFAPLRQTSTTPSPGSVGSGSHARIALSSSSAASSAPAAAYSYNNNLLYCGNATMAFAAMEATADSTAADVGAMLPESSLLVQTPESTTDMFIDTTAINDLSQRLQAELRTAKTRHLACTEVSIPWDLTPRIAAEIIRMSECEPCGIRGCTIFIEFEDEPSNIRRIASFKMDPNTVSTFELYLTLKQDKSGWTSILPQFLKNLTRSSTILISPDFTLTKNKLYSGE